jgi:methyl-accepting chemotaxis protein
MRTISQQVERSSQEQSRGSRQITQSIETINNLVNQLNSAHRSQARGSERALTAAAQIEEAARRQDHALRDLITSTERMKKSVA